MTQTSNQYFEHIAENWDTLRAGYFPEALRKSAIEKAYLRPEMIAADIGAGTGFMSAALAPLLAKVHLIDNSPAMLAVARKNLGKFFNVEYHLAEGSSLTLPDGSVDVVFANMYLHHCLDPLAAIREMVRILKPGGRLVITDLDTHSHAWLKEEMADEWMGFERSQVRAWFKAVDLVNVLVDCTGESCCAESNSEAVPETGENIANISVFLATGTRRLKMRDEVQSNYATIAEQTGSCCSGGAAQSTSCCSGEAYQTTSCCSGETRSSTSCCSQDADLPVQDVQFITDYSSAEKAAVPVEAEAIALGCGNPTAMANLRAGETVLDIGSGGGMDAFLAARKVGPTGQVIGVDMTPAMLKRARASAKRAGLTNVKFRHGHAESLPVAENTVDVILSNCVINLCEDKALVFQESFRVLKPGGRLEVSDIVTSGPVSAQSRQKAGEWAGCVSGALPEQEYLDLVAQAGFGHVRSRRGASSGQADGVQIYSAYVSAIKPENGIHQESQASQATGCCG